MNMQHILEYNKLMWNIARGALNEYATWTFKRRWQNINIVVITEVMFDCEDWIHLAQTQ